MKKISEFLNKYGSDKCAKHAYGIVYDDFFSKYDRNTELNILEIGVEHGGSLLAWKDYFPNARVTGVDIKDVRQYKRDDVEFMLSDVKNYKPDRQFDIIIDDGSHYDKDVLWAATNLSLSLKPGGIMIIEDVQKEYEITRKIAKNLDGKFIVSVMDLRKVQGWYDDFLIFIWKIT